jgi:hypothetical protein
MRAIKAAVCAALLVAAAPAVAFEIEISRSEYKMMRAGQTIEEWSWQALVWNGGPERVSCRVENEFLDAGGFIVQRDSERVNLESGEEKWVRGQTVTDRPSGIEASNTKVFCR